MRSSELQQAIELARSGRKEAAREILVQIIRANPRNETAWLWLVDTLEDDASRITALELFLKIQPSSTTARQAVQSLQARAKDASPAAPLATDIDNSASDSTALPTEIQQAQAALKAPTLRRSWIRWVLGCLTLLVLCGMGLIYWYMSTLPGATTLSYVQPSVKTPTLQPGQITTESASMPVVVPNAPGTPLVNAAAGKDPIAVATPIPITVLLAGEPVSTEALALYYSFDQQGNLTQDLSRRESNGLLTGGEWVVDGARSAALAFDGVDDQVLVPAMPGMNLGAQFTLAVSVRVDDFTAERPLLEWHNGRKAGTSLWAYRTGYPWDSSPAGADLVGATGDENHHVIAEAAFSPGKWHHLAVVYDAAQGRAWLYLDGTLAQETAPGSFEAQTSYNLRIGASLDGEKAFFKGQLDEVRIYARALHPDEIRALAAYGLPD